MWWKKLLVHLFFLLMMVGSLFWLWFSVLYIGFSGKTWDLPNLLEAWTPLVANFILWVVTTWLFHVKNIFPKWILYYIGGIITLIGGYTLYHSL